MIESQLLALGIDGKWLEPLNAVMDKYEINTKNRQAAFPEDPSFENGARP